MLQSRPSRLARPVATVLVVEDDEDLRDLVVDTLRRDGYVVLAASSAEEAEDVLEERAHRIDLVLSDVHMPGRLDGVAVAQLLRATCPCTPLILMTAFPEPTLHVAAADVRALVLSKPFRLEVLRSAVLKAIAAAHVKAFGTRARDGQIPS